MTNSQTMLLTTVVDQRLIELRLSLSDAKRYLEAASEAAQTTIKDNERQAAFDHLEAMRWKFHDARVKLERYEAEKCQRQVPLVRVTADQGWDDSIHDWCCGEVSCDW